MNLIKTDFVDPTMNLALEEYTLTKLKGEFIILWRNAESVILGKNQNALSELDLDYIREKKINVVRRISGGGAVFHDLGNINFSFIEDYAPELFNNYSRFTAPIIAYLRSLDINAELSGRNDILVDGVKISGNAQAVRDSRILHHGTLLYSADLSKLAKALKPKEIKHIGKEIKSVFNRVANISTLAPNLPDVEVFMDELNNYFKTQNEIIEYEFTDKQMKEIEELADSKYRQYTWNYGQTPKFTVEKSEKFNFGIVEIYYDVVEGYFKNIKFHGDFFGIMEIDKLAMKIENKKFKKEDITEILQEVDVKRYISGITVEELVNLIFE